MIRKTDKGVHGGWLPVCTAVWFFLAAVGAGSPMANAQAAVAALDTSQLTGTWYEVGEYGVKRERNCAGDTVLLISPGNKPNQLLFVDSCYNRKHYTDGWSNLVFWKKGTQPTANLKVRTLPLLSRPLTVVGLQPGSWMLLGTAKHKSLQLYSRTVTLQEAAIATAQADAASAGYSGALVPTPQPSR